MKIIYLVFANIFLLTLSQGSVLGQTANNQERVPKQKSIELGYRYVIYDNFQNTALHGVSLMFDYGWQVSGLNKKKAVFITIPVGYAYTLAKDRMNEVDVRILSYGWTIRHELAKNKNAVPFIGYGLLMNQLAFNGTDGSVMGHQTRFEFGYNFRNLKKLKYFVKAEYSFSSFAKLGDKRRNYIHSMDIKTGIRF
jgi:hypothetical protein